MIKAVIIGFSHMHCNEVALYVSENPDFSLVGIAEIKSGLEDIHAYTYTPVWNLENVKNNYCDNCYDDYRIMLDELKTALAEKNIAFKYSPAAVAHIAKNSTHHSEAIITENKENAAYFTAAVDSAAVYVNASTRFTDGGEFGLGCEIGISTQKLHARGPMGLCELTTYKYVIHGNGQIR